MDDVSPDREALIRDDPYCALLGIELVSIGSGSATTEVVLTDDHLNFHGAPHGGVIYSLADAAFAAASNADGDDAVALETNISYLEAVEVGTTLTATAGRTHETRSTGEYEVVVTAGDGATETAGSGTDAAETDDPNTGATDDPNTDPAETDANAEAGSERIATFRGRVYRP